MRPLEGCDARSGLNGENGRTSLRPHRRRARRLRGRPRRRGGCRPLADGRGARGQDLHANRPGIPFVGGGRRQAVGDRREANPPRGRAPRSRAGRDGSSGTPEWFAEALLALFAAIRRGELDAVTGAVARVLGTEPRAFAEYAREELLTPSPPSCSPTAAERFRAVVADGNFEIARGEAKEPDATIETDVGTLVALIYEGRPLAEALRAGEMKVEGGGPENSQMGCEN